ncbi:hypothetical protein DRW48_09735 [Paracoccus suum]|uniref:Uncharacterized protein n=1 Tax=Paracoccus suum TaxID=2259340 RepID=A0A344PKN2_9RHOB|nr:hypothetical protein [Paracoccus suum]AXC49937.1 hypothetical protein DRW48_09735 [Paracoccus suum]
MKKLILHIGQYKTGSTSIQKTLDHNRARLINHGILYPETGCRTWQHGGLIKGLKRELHKDRPDSFDSAPLLEEIEASGCKHVIISCEGISGGRISHMDPPLVEHMLSRMGEVANGWDITVVWYYRRQDDAIESRIIQTVKGKAAVSRPDPAPYMKFGEALDYPFFQSVVQKALPQAQIVPRCFSRALLAEGDVVRDFCKIAGIDDALRPEDILEGNVSPTGSSIGLQLALNLLIGGGYEVDPIIRNIRRMGNQEVGEKASAFGPETRREIMDFFAESNAKFIQEHVPAEDRAKVAAHFAAPVSPRPENITVGAEMLAHALMQAGAAITFDTVKTRRARQRGKHR